MRPTIPVLYSFRRCPYAIRARMALEYSGIEVEIKEIELRNKSSEFLALSPKGTVPVLVLPSGEIIDQSWEIMLWALNQRDPDDWWPQDVDIRNEIEKLVAANDLQFKPLLDRYKYSVRYPELSTVEHRSMAEKFIENIEERLTAGIFLMGSKLTVVDVAVFPFLRQFVAVDDNWFQGSAYNQLKKYMAHFEKTEIFQKVMAKKQFKAPAMNS